MPPIILLTDMVTRSRLLAAHGLTSCLSVRTQPLTATGAPSQTSTIPYHTIPYHTILPWRSLCPQRMATVIGGPWPEHLNSPANTYYQTRPVITMTSSLMTTHWGRVPSVHRIYYPVLDVGPKPNSFVPTLCRVFPCPPIILLTDMVTRSRLLAAHGLTSCLSVRTQPLTATGAPSQTSTIPYHTIPYQYPISAFTIDHTIPL